MAYEDEMAALTECPWGEAGTSEFFSRVLIIFSQAFISVGLISLVVYLFVEKPSMDAKRVFKNKYE
jgi:hypothetical protein